MKKNNKIFIPVFVILLAILVYALGFSSNVAYGDENNIVDRNALVAFEAFQADVQPFNDLIFGFAIVMFLILLSVYLTSTHKRTKLLTSNVVTSSALSASMIIFAIINFIKLPSFVATYSQILIDFPEQIERSKRISSLIPTNNMYYFGFVISAISLLYAIFMIAALIKRIKFQKAYIAKRSEVLNNATWEVKIST